MATSTYSDIEAAKALVDVIGNSRWSAVAIAHGYLIQASVADEKDAARVIFDRGGLTLTKCREVVRGFAERGFLAMLEKRERTGAAQNPITKLFPATITEQRFLEVLDELRGRRPRLDYSDDHEKGHTLSDYTLLEGDLALPINIKNAGTRFERAQQLVGLAPDDCVPIPSYKAHAAVEQLPNLLYVVSVDYDLLPQLTPLLPTLLSKEESIVWDLLNRFSGSLVRNAEDLFIFATVRRYWDRLRPITNDTPFQVISARKAIRILQTKPHRTPGIGLRAWGTGASAEVNFHISIKEEMTPWDAVCDRIVANGVDDIVRAVNRKRIEEVYDPEI